MRLGSFSVGGSPVQLQVIRCSALGRCLQEFIVVDSWCGVCSLPSDALCWSAGLLEDFFFFRLNISVIVTHWSERTQKHEDRKWKECHKTGTDVQLQQRWSRHHHRPEIILVFVYLSAVLYYNPLWAHTGQSGLKWGSYSSIEPWIGLHGVRMETEGFAFHHNNLPWRRLWKSRGLRVCVLRKEKETRFSELFWFHFHRGSGDQTPAPPHGCVCSPRGSSVD